jgi:hypothetical protein
LVFKYGSKRRIEKNRIKFIGRINNHNRHAKWKLIIEKNNYLFPLTEKPRHALPVSIRLRKLSAEIKLVSQYGSTCTCPYPEKKMDTLFLGVPDVVPRRVLWFFSRKPKRAYDRASAGTAIHESPVKRPGGRYNCT